MELITHPTGHDLKVERVQARVKAIDLAAQMGVSGSRIAAIEREQFPSLETIRRFREALETCQNVQNGSSAA